MRSLRILPFLLAAATLLAACGGPDTTHDGGDAAATDQDPGAALAALFHDYDEEYLRLNPFSATFRGDHRFDDQWYPLDPLTEEYREASHDLDRRYLARLLEIDPADLSELDRLNYEIFRYNRENAIEREDLGYNEFENLLPVDQFFSMPNFLVMLGSGATAQPFATAEDFDNWLSRSAGFAEHVDNTIAKMREGVEAGVVQPTVLMQKALPQLAAQVVDAAEDSDFWRPVANMPESVTGAERERIEAAYHDHITNVLVPAYAKLHDYIRDEYTKHTRDTVGISAVPGGADYYAFRVREMTTTDLSPEEIHEIGKQEAARLYAEMQRVRDEVGFEGDMAAFFEHLKTDPQFYFTEELALVDAYDALREKINPTLDALFDVQPKTDYVVKPVEAFRAQSMAAAQYFPGTPDGSRPGIFYINSFDLPARPKWMMEALSIHEASPGHHFQISIAQELEGMPAFRRFGGYTAYVEGWGLYAESLGQELGLYTDPYQYFGALYADIWRANRLVVDTGLHAFGWTREEAIEWMQSNSPVPDTDAVAEVERYIAIPGQALAYKIGQLKIRELRDKAEAALGDAFDVREFHNQVLTTGALPLMVLEDKIERWIASQQT
ncbi:MAG: DUF885 domain-containing protein [Woeseiaceae bacterium]|nr:DUF885 domain-containing protein [Woeseiaceae bacterium]